MTNETLEQKVGEKILVICAETKRLVNMQRRCGAKADLAATLITKRLEKGEYHIPLAQSSTTPAYMEQSYIETTPDGQEILQDSQTSLSIIERMLRDKKYEAIIISGDLGVGLGSNYHADEPGFHIEDGDDLHGFNYAGVSDGECIARSIKRGNFGDLNKTTPLYTMAYRKNSIQSDLLAGDFYHFIQKFLSNTEEKTK